MCVLVYAELLIKIDNYDYGHGAKIMRSMLYAVWD